MDRDEFIRLGDDWARAVLNEALALYDRGTPPTHCLRFAIDIVDARENVKRAQRQALRIPPLPMVRN